MTGFAPHASFRRAPPRTRMLSDWAWALVSLTLAAICAWTTVHAEGAEILIIGAATAALAVSGGCYFKRWIERS